jgi:hypothetical protein
MSSSVEVSEDSGPCLPPAANPFLTAEQALVNAPPVVPHWFAVDDGLLRCDGDVLVRDTLADLLPLQVPGHTVPVPVLPRFADRVRRLTAGVEGITDLGPAGPAWAPIEAGTALYRAQSPVILQPTRPRAMLDHGLAVHRMLDAGLKQALHAEHPRFDLVRDLGVLTVTGVGTLNLGLRDNPFGPGDRVCCVAGLAEISPDTGRSLLAAIVDRPRLRLGRSVEDTTEEWFRRYLDLVVAPMLWLYDAYGLALAARLDTALVVLDPDGRPIGGRFRNTADTRVAAVRGGGLSRWLAPGVLIRPDEEALAWAGSGLGRGNVLALVEACAGQRLCPAEPLADAWRELLRARAREHPGGLAQWLLSGAY